LKPLSWVCVTVGLIISSSKFIFVNLNKSLCFKEDLGLIDRNSFVNIVKNYYEHNAQNSPENLLNIQEKILIHQKLQSFA